VSGPLCSRNPYSAKLSEGQFDSPIYGIQMDPKGKVALLTGGARIGQIVAHGLAARGCDLALVYRGSREAAEASAKAAIGVGVRAITIQADATNEDQIVAAVKETHRALGRIDILLNMASIYLSTPDPNEADWFEYD
jgi:3-oxoacyl-[acyl-carrier protein] reductase